MSPSTVSLGQSRGLAADVNSLNNLKAQAGKDQKGAVKEAAKQFEALFMRELLKSMREATMKSGLVDSETGDLGADLLDQQYANQMTGLPGGLSAMIERQLSQQITPSAIPTDAAKVGEPGATKAVPHSTIDRAAASGSRQQQFVSRLGDAAQQVAAEVGIPASYMLGQAGHETGWGRSEIKQADGSNSFNVFGIKAGKGWTGKVAEVTTTEYVDGQPQKVKAKFRAYDSYADAFRDYARMISQSPRYAKVMDNLHSAQSFASGLQRAGYATDPQYATKLSRAINTALNLQRAQA
ncbi:flagellar assembly peptidoglycan hydrolase FlgJ [Hydrogenophaga sp. OTU3427]|uniref:flagellar assembly peptidoglycan hydrolase FlgJ n=1 Tax=Hydrogenophaga sp. OTU3427 TaxID=3043856 RepID=UPI00313B0F95